MKENKTKVEHRNRNSEEDAYNSFSEWQMESFPNLIKKRKRKELKDIEALSSAIADDIVREVCVELSRHSKHR